MFGDICVDLISERRSKAKTLPLSKVCPWKITGSNFSSCLLFTINFFFFNFPWPPTYCRGLSKRLPRCAKENYTLFPHLAQYETTAKFISFPIQNFLCSCLRKVDWFQICRNQTFSLQKAGCVCKGEPVRKSAEHNYFFYFTLRVLRSPIDRVFKNRRNTFVFLLSTAISKCALSVVRISKTNFQVVAIVLNNLSYRPTDFLQ